MLSRPFDHYYNNYIQGIKARPQRNSASKQFHSLLSGARCELFKFELGRANILWLPLSVCQCMGVGLCVVVYRRMVL